MKPWLRVALVSLLSLIWANCSHADLPGVGPRPRRPIPVHPTNAVPVVIESGADGAQARLLVPRSLLGRAKKRIVVGALGTRTLPIAIVLSLSLVSGLYLVRPRNRPLVRSLAVLVTLVALLGIGTSMLGANPVPPPGTVQQIIVPADGRALKLANVRVEITEQGGAIRLLVPRAKLAALSAKESR